MPVNRGTRRLASLAVEEGGNGRRGEGWVSKRLTEYKKLDPLTFQKRNELPEVGLKPAINCIPSTCFW